MAPPVGWMPKAWRLKRSPEVKKRQTYDLTYGEMAAKPIFWLMYLMMAMVAFGGLMALAQLKPIARFLRSIRSVICWGACRRWSLRSLDRLVNGLCRPFWGWVSDHIGREQTMSMAFGLEAIAIYVLLRFAYNPLLFVVFSAFTFFGWGEIFSLFPALCGDFFGRKHATENYGFLYTAKGTASMFVPVGSALAAGKAFDFRADILLLLGGVLVLFAVFVGPTVLRLRLSRNAKVILLSVAGVLIIYGIILTVVPTVWTPFAAKFTMPNTGWRGVFRVAIFFDAIAAVLAFFVLRRMKAPVHREVPGVAPQLTPATRVVA